jgi:adenosylcobinamide-phosphate synthase
VALDALLGDPRRFHPVAAFGRAAAALESRDYADSRLRGAAHAAACVLAVAVPAALLHRRMRGRPPSEAVAAALAVWAVTGARSLHHEAERAMVALARNDPPAARRVLPSLCGRDPVGLDATQITRAVIESVAENTSDAVVAPLLWGAVAGLPIAPSTRSTPWWATARPGTCATAGLRPAWTTWPTGSPPGSPPRSPWPVPLLP